MESRLEIINFCYNCGFDISDRYEISKNNGFLEQVYSVITFFKDLKKIISKVEGRSINYRQLSKKFLNKTSKWYLNDRILRAKGNPNWKLKFQMLYELENTLIEKIGKKRFNKLIKPCFDQYVSINFREDFNREYSEFTILYFAEINTKQKMYWLLWLLAEGNFTHKAIKIEINPKDGILLKRFVKDLKINPGWVFYSRRLSSKTGKYYKSFVLEIHSKDMIENIKQGVSKLYPNHIQVENFLIGKKSHRIRFPRFAPKELLMAGVLGFFDGDGTHSGDTARIGNIMSKLFLDDIVEIFDFKHTETKEHWENGRIRGYYLTLGAEFFNELLLNFERSLPRKRRFYTRIVHKFPLTQHQLQTLASNNPGSSGSDLATLIFEQTGIKVGRMTVLQKLLDWKIQNISKEEWQKKTIIKLRYLGWDLKRIWIDSSIGLGLSSSSWGKNRWRFFKRIFKDDPFVMRETGNITEQIEKAYTPRK
jgi:hypothetical protein